MLARHKSGRGRQKFSTQKDAFFSYYISYIRHCKIFERLGVLGQLKQDHLNWGHHNTYMIVKITKMIY